ncbi:MAG: MarR family transcriptional regulator [Desulfurivibrionaceae bacterium]|nr:MarR family transcriptional regulator [Desulfobulbales bacterium]MDT8335535.1 MarR family transcriptional regulator [Desulfurivibrionaceae bacterium]
MTVCNEESLARQIYLTARDMRNFAEKLLKPFCLTMEQFHLLNKLADNSGISQRQLGEAADKSPANMTRILDRIEAKGLAVRREDPGDRRSSLVFLTDKGAVLVEEVFGVFNSYSARVVSGIAAADQRLAREVLVKMGDNLNKMAEKTAENIKR